MSQGPAVFHFHWVNKGEIRGLQFVNGPMVANQNAYNQNQIKIKEFPNRIKEFPNKIKYFSLIGMSHKIKEFPNKIKEFAQYSRIK